MRHRKSLRSLATTRIYAKGKRLYFFSAEPTENPRTGKVAKWHPLGLISDGEDKARALAAEIVKHNAGKTSAGDLPEHMETYRVALLAKREKKRPKEKARERMFSESQKELTRQCNMFADAFEDFDLEQVAPVDIAKFLDQWEGQRAAELYRARLSDFFAWACRRGLRENNPVREVKVEKPKKRKRYITDAEFIAIRDALLIGDDKKPTPSGPMVQAYVDLCYLLYQRTTEIRLLKWTDIDEEAGVIHFKPTKTEESSGATVDVRITPEVKDALERAKAHGKIKSFYVVCTLHGQPYDAHGLGTAWRRACKRAGIEGATLKDLRAKAATDAKKAGYKLEQISVGLAHTDEGMTTEYIKLRDTPVSEVELRLPTKKAAGEN